MTLLPDPDELDFDPDDDDFIMSDYDPEKDSYLEYLKDQPARYDYDYDVDDYPYGYGEE